MAKEIKHSRDLVHYVNRSHTYPSNNARSLALYIADFYNPKLGYSFPSQEKMAEAFSTHRPTIRRWLKEIESTNYWTVEKGGLGNGSRYFLSDEELENVSEFLEAESDHERTNDDVAKVSPSTRQVRNLPAKEEPEVYIQTPLPKKYPKDVTELKLKMRPYGFRPYRKPAPFKDLTFEKQELINLLMSYLIQFDVVNDKDVNSMAKKMVDTWLLHPKTDQEKFYNRYMHFLEDNKNGFST